MKVKYKPEDFIVEEVLKEGMILENARERYKVYLVQKKMLDTLSVMYDISRRLKIQRNRIYSCGLKDKYAIAKQYIAVEVENAPKKISGQNWEAQMVGSAKAPLSAKSIFRNIFRITLRDIHPEEVKEYENNIKIVSSVGFPNYFDEQRFGSARHFADEKINQDDILDFIGKRALQGDWEGALKIHFQALSDSDRSRVKKFKKIMREKWGKWSECLVEAQEKNDIDVLRYLVRKQNDFKGAFFRIDSRLARLYLEVYQNFIFNEILCEIIKQRFPHHYLFPYFVGNLVFPYRPDISNVSIVKNIIIPLPHKDAQIPHEITEIYHKILERERVSLQMFDTGDPKINFAKSMRNAWERPEQLNWKIQDDEYHQGMKKIEISFSLRPGTFATVLIKNITPLNPKSDTEKKPNPIVYDQNGKEVVIHQKTQTEEKKKFIIISRSTS